MSFEQILFEFKFHIQFNEHFRKRHLQISDYLHVKLFVHKSHLKNIYTYSLFKLAHVFLIIYINIDTSFKFSLILILKIIHFEIRRHKSIENIS